MTTQKLNGDIKNTAEVELLRTKIALMERKQRLAEGLPHLYGLKMYPWQHNIFHSLNKRIFCCSANQIGKGLLLDTPVSTPDGFVELGDIQIGDMVHDERGEPTKVTDIPYVGVRPFYKITFDDGTTIETSQEHLWKVQTEKQRFRPYYTRSNGEKYPSPHYGQWLTLETQEIIKQCGYDNGKVRNSKKAVVPVCEPVEYPEKELLLDPYIMGAMISDGCFTTMRFHCGDRQVIDRVAYGNITDSKTSNLYSTSVGRYGKAVARYNAVKTSDSKFIPEDYLFGSVEQRINLLNGLMDTDGSIYGKNQIEYCTVSPKLKDQFIQLVNSLGGIVNKVTKRTGWYYDGCGNKVACKDAYYVRFRIQINPFWLKRKADKWRKDIRYRHQRIIESIEYAGEKKCKCISVDSEDSTFLAGKEYIVTHNSTSQIRKCINIATNKELWKAMFPIQYANNSNFRPVIWYLYPDDGTITREVTEKWVREFLPRGEYETDKWYGWKILKRDKKIRGIRFNCGTIINFMSYTQDVHHLQSGTVNVIATDEELPEHLYPELNARLFATDGYFYMAFTATRGQEFWRRVIEPKDTEDEPMPDALKIQVSMFDCLRYQDGSKSHWTKERIEQIISSCRNENEVKRRVFGKFIRSDGLKYHAFDRATNYVPYPMKNGQPFKGVPHGWDIVSGVDIGSGGEKNHPAAFAFLSINKDRTKVRLFKGRRLDGIETTAGDIYKHYKIARGNMKLLRQSYDWAAKDFDTITNRAHDKFYKAEKSHEVGEEILNTAFALGVFKIYQDPEHDKLVEELESLDNEINKRQAKDDFIDAVRYAIASAPIDWKKVFSDIEKGVKVVEQERNDERELRPRDYIDKPSGNIDDMFDDVGEELEYWSQYY